MRTEKRVDEIQASITKVLSCRVSVQVENGRDEYPFVGVSWVVICSVTFSTSVTFVESY